jgi:type I restriction enzyme M protein
MKDPLNQIWSLFRKAGIADDLRIIEHIGAILTEGRKAPSDDLQPSWPKNKDLDISSIKYLLQEASTNAGNTAKLFDRHILFRLPEILPGGRYPTPRHIVKFMRAITDVQPHHSLADFACGSGGFLVNRDMGNHTSMTTGWEIAKEWAKIAWANCVLHNLPSDSIKPINSLFLLTKKESTPVTPFDRVLMNPSFGVEIDKYLVGEAFGWTTSGRSETALARLALEKVALDGKVGVLLPSGVLYSNTLADNSLRRELVDRYCLETVIRLPKDSFQPYSQMQTNLFVAKKKESMATDMVWFFTPGSDGYPSGRGRDLTKEPDEVNDLPLIESVMKPQTKEWSRKLPPKGSVIGLKTLINAAGYEIGIIGAAKLFIFEHYLSAPTEPLLLLGVIRSNKKYVWIKIDIEKGKHLIVKNRQEFLKSIFGKKAKVDDIPRRCLISEKSDVTGFVITRDVRVLGVKVQKNEIIKNSYDLRPEKYVPAVEEERRLESPATLLANIRKNQKAFLTRIDNLMGRLDAPPIASEKIPSPVLQEMGNIIQPFGNLSNTQKRVWNLIQEKIENYQKGIEASYMIPVHFATDEIDPDALERTSSSTLQSIELFEKMGLIIPVKIVSPESSKEASCYRLLSKRDVWVSDEGDATVQEVSE